jgi:histidine ammonia-lyase
MAAHGARRLADMNRNLTHIIGIELMLAAQGVHLRAPLTTSPVLGQVVAGLRSEIPALGGDRYMSREMRRVGELIAGGSLLPVAEAALSVGLEAA